MKKALLCIIVCLGMALGWALPANAIDVSIADFYRVNDSGSRAYFSYVTSERGNLNTFYGSSTSYITIPANNHTGGAFYIDSYIRNSSNSTFLISPNSILVYTITTDNLEYMNSGHSDNQTSNLGCYQIGQNGTWTTWECIAINYSSIASGQWYVSNWWRRAVDGYDIKFVYGSWVQLKSNSSDYISLLTDIRNNTSTNNSYLENIYSLIDAYKTQNNNNWNRQHQDILDLSDRINRNFNMLDGSLDSISSEQQDTNDKLDREWEQEQDDRDNIEQQSSDVNDAAESSSEDATEAGTTLLAAFSAFVTAITNASPSNCNIDMDLGNLDLGVVNLCQLSLPPALSAIGSILLIAFCVPLSIATATKMIRLFRSFSG